VQNIWKTIKHTENTNSQKAIAIHWTKASGGQQHWLIHWRWLIYLTHQLSIFCSSFTRYLLDYFLLLNF